MPCAARLVVPGLAALALSAGAAPAHAEGTPTTFPRAVAVTGVDPQIAITRFTVTVRSVSRSSVRLSVAVTAASTGRARTVVVAAGAGSGGQVTSPLCRPTARTTVRLRTTSTSWTRTLTVPRPAKTRDAIRVTLTPAGQAIPYLPERVGGGAGGAELLLNGGAWRLARGSAWGLTSSLPAGATLTSVRFTSRAYAWAGSSTADRTVATQIGEEGQPPRYDFPGTMRADQPFRFRRQPTFGIQSRSSAWALVYGATLDGARAWTLRMPMPAWAG